MCVCVFVFFFFFGRGSGGDGVGCTGEKEEMAHLCVCTGPLYCIALLLLSQISPVIGLRKRAVI